MKLIPTALGILWSCFLMLAFCGLMAGAASMFLLGLVGIVLDTFAIIFVTNRGDLG